MDAIKCTYVRHRCGRVHRCGEQMWYICSEVYGCGPDNWGRRDIIFTMLSNTYILL